MDDTALENVGSKSPAMSKRIQHAIVSEALEVLTRFAESVAPTHDVTDSEPFSDEVVECCIAGFDVPSVLTGDSSVRASDSIASTASYSINVRS